MRISFQLDLKHNEDLAFLRDIHRHGDRPRELIRLAIKGRRREIELEQLSRAGHSFVMRGIESEQMVHSQALPVVAGAQPAAPSAPQGAHHAAPHAAPPSPQYSPAQQPPVQQAPQAPAQASVTAAQPKPVARESLSDSSGTSPSETSGASPAATNGFLA